MAKRNLKYIECYTDNLHIFFGLFLKISFAAFAINFVLSVFLVPPKCFLGEAHVFPVGAVSVFSVILSEILYWRRIRKILDAKDPSDSREGEG